MKVDLLPAKATEVCGDTLLPLRDFVVLDGHDLRRIQLVRGLTQIFISVEHGRWLPLDR